MSKTTGTLLFAFALVSLVLSNSTALAAGGAIKISNDVPYMNKGTIDSNVIKECEQLGTKLGKYLNQYATKYGVATELVDKLDSSAQGQVLVVKITTAVSGGNFFIGHHKSMSAHAELFENGVSQGEVTFTRNSGGGFAAGYKSSCSVLGRCSKALGKDFAAWLRDRNK